MNKQISCRRTMIYLLAVLMALVTGALTVAGATPQEENSTAPSSAQTRSKSVSAGTSDFDPNPLKVATLRWYPANGTANFAVGSNPFGVAFHGADIWVCNSESGTGGNGTNSLTKLAANDGKVLANVTLETGCQLLAYDGANIWVTNSGGVVYKVRASDGAVQATVSLGGFTRGVAFDGTSIWVTNWTNNTLIRLAQSTGQVQGVFTVSFQPYAVIFDSSTTCGCRITEVTRS